MCYRISQEVYTPAAQLHTSISRALSAADMMAHPWPSSAGAQQMIEIVHVIPRGWNLERKAFVGTFTMFCQQRSPLQHTMPSDCSAAMILLVCMYTSHTHQDDHRYRHFVLGPNPLQPPSSHDDMRLTQIACLGLYAAIYHVDIRSVPVYHR